MRKLGEMSLQELQDLYDKNKDFAREVDERVMNIQYETQSEQFDLVGAKVFDYSNHYTSFYLTTPMHYGAKDGWSVAHKLNRDYMADSTAQIYDKLNALADELENMESDELAENKDEYENRMNNICDALAEALTNDLRCYEQFDKHDVENYLQAVADNLYRMSEWETDGTVVYEHVTWEYK